MLDLVTLIKIELDECEAERIIKTNYLKATHRDGRLFYDNVAEKNLEQNAGVYIKIEAGRLKLECSLHKYHNETHGKKRTNYDLFTMTAAQKTIYELLRNKGIDPDKVNIYAFEIGINIPVKSDCRRYMDKMQTIGIGNRQREFIPNQKYKDKRVKTTLFHYTIKKYYKAYDKCYEMADRKSKEAPPDENILRLETSFRRVENKTVDEFFSMPNLTKYMHQFFNDWETVHFQRDIITPKGTSQAKRRLCSDIMENGALQTLNKATESHKAGSLTDRQFRTIREFIQKEWDKFKLEIRMEASPEEVEFRNLLKEYRILYK